MNMPTCPLKSHNPECNPACAWYDKETEGCTIWKLAEAVTCIAAEVARIKDQMPASSEPVEEIYDEEKRVD